MNKVSCHEHCWKLPNSLMGSAVVHCANFRSKPSRHMRMWVVVIFSWVETYVC